MNDEFKLKVIKNRIMRLVANIQTLNEEIQELLEDYTFTSLVLENENAFRLLAEDIE